MNAIRKLSLTGLVLATLPTMAFADSMSMSINDTFIGNGEPSGYAGQDVVGDVAKFDTSKSVISLSDDRSTLTIDIYSTYFANVGELGTYNGALFLNVSGDPAGVAASGNNSPSGRWTNVVKLDNNTKGLNNTLKPMGSAFVYELITRESVVTSDQAVPQISGYQYRSGYDVDLNSSGLGVLSTGLASWSMTDVKQTGYDYLRFIIPTSTLGGAVVLNSTIDFAWAATCANDVISGSVKLSQVPEPSTMILLGMGAFGLVRKKMKV
jgi:hypothetical protein